MLINPKSELDKLLSLDCQANARFLLSIDSK